MANDNKKIVMSQVKQLRTDARKLEVIAKHLRLEAKSQVNLLKAEERAEQARANFFSKQSKVDPNIILIPKEQIFAEEKEDIDNGS